jgi:hypothetical protein
MQRTVDEPWAGALDKGTEFRDGGGSRQEIGDPAVRPMVPRECLRCAVLGVRAGKDFDSRDRSAKRAASTRVRARGGDPSASQKQTTTVERRDQGQL